MQLFSRIALQLKWHPLLGIIFLTLSAPLFADEIVWNPCTDCGSWLIGSARLDLQNIRWTGGNQFSNYVEVNFGPLGEFSFTGPINSRAESNLNYWFLGNAGVSANPTVQPEPLGYYFAPATDGTVISAMSYNIFTLAGQLVRKGATVQGKGVADRPEDPVITLDVEPVGVTAIPCFLQNQQNRNCIQTGVGGTVTFKVTPKVRGVKTRQSEEPSTEISGELNEWDLKHATEISQVEHVMISLVIEDQGTNCRTVNPAFGEYNFKRNGGMVPLNDLYNRASYFHYLEAGGPNNTPSFCPRSYSFLTSISNSFEFSVSNRRETGKGSEKYTFYIRGHSGTEWEGTSQQTFYLTTADITPVPEIRVFKTTDKDEKEIIKDTTVVMTEDGSGHQSVGITIKSEGSKELQVQNVSIDKEGFTFTSPADTVFPILIPSTFMVGPEESLGKKEFTITLGNAKDIKECKYSGKVTLFNDDADERELAFNVEGTISLETLLTDSEKAGMAKCKTCADSLAKGETCTDTDKSDCALTGLTRSFFANIGDTTAYRGCVNYCQGACSIDATLSGCNTCQLPSYNNCDSFLPNDLQDICSIDPSAEVCVVKKVSEKSGEKQGMEICKTCASNLSTCLDATKTACGFDGVIETTINTTKEDCKTNPVNCGITVTPPLDCTLKDNEVACGIIKDGKPTPLVKDVCKADPFGCVGIVENTDPASEFSIRKTNCKTYFPGSYTEPTYWTRQEGNQFIGMLYLPKVNLFKPDATKLIAGDPNQQKDLCIAAFLPPQPDLNKPDVSKSIFQVIHPWR